MLLIKTEKGKIGESLLQKLLLSVIPGNIPVAPHDK